MNTKKLDLAQSPQEILTELREMVAAAEDLMSENGTDDSASILAKLRGRFQAAQRKLGYVYSGVRRTVVRGAKYTDTTIRQNPYQTAAVAAGIGALVGILIARGRDD